MHILVETLGFSIVTAAILAMGSVGLTLQFGVTNYPNFAFGDFMTVGIYICWLFAHALPLWLAIVLGALVVGAVALLSAEFVMGPFVKKRSSPLILLIVTFGLSFIINNIILAIWGAQSKSLPMASESPLHLGWFLFTPSQLVVVGASVVVMLAVHLMLSRSRLGKAMRAVSDDSQLAAVSGIAEVPIVRLTWVLTGVLAGLGGIALAYNTASFDPALGETFLYVFFASVILGGVGKPYGAMLGAIVIGLASGFAALILPQYGKDAAFLVLIVVLLFRPEGIIRSAGRSH